MKKDKYRAWVKHEMVYWDVIKDWEFIALEFTPMMKYTKLDDKNNKEIYEDDIIKIGDQLSLVEYGAHTGCPSVPDFHGAYYLHEVNKTCEVIGNKYENPELLNILNKPMEVN